MFYLFTKTNFYSHLVSVNFVLDLHPNLPFLIPKKLSVRISHSLLFQLLASYPHLLCQRDGNMLISPIMQSCAVPCIRAGQMLNLRCVAQGVRVAVREMLCGLAVKWPHLRAPALTAVKWPLPSRSHDCVCPPATVSMVTKVGPCRSCLCVSAGSERAGHSYLQACF